MKKTTTNRLRDSLLVFAHRGGGGRWPQNTLHAFHQAAELGVDALETDIHTTADGVIVICHDCKAAVPNPNGIDWIRYEPRLQETAKGPTRSRVFEWCDHFLFIGYDVNVNKDGKGSGSGTRAMYPAELPTHKAKSRDIASTIVYRDGEPELWKLLFGVS
jgi:glycerophosphoryl diester phosphodiesterase